jgi:hypothetical protein
MLTISVAGIVFGVEHTYPHIARQCAPYIVKAEPTHTFSVTPEMIAREKRSATGEVSDGYCESLAACREIARRLMAHDALLLHSAVIELDGGAIAFSARSGTGKSTHIKLWKRVYGDRVKIVNGDKPIVRFADDGVPVAYGTPWAGKEGWQRNVGVPLRSIVILRRGEQDRLLPISREEAALELLQQILLGDTAEETAASMELVDRLIASVDLRVLYCTPTEEAARVAFEGLFGN